MFAKAPRAGFVKTRLTAAISGEDAAEFHRNCVLEVWDKLRRACDAKVFLYSDIADAAWRELAGAEKFRLQRGADLGRKMLCCLDELLGAGYRDALIVGSDSPTLPVGYIDDAVRALETSDVVLGPSEDGGYYLIGARRTKQSMFAGVSWSDEQTRARTIRAVEAAGLDITEVGEWYDVDQPADLERLRLDPALSPRLRKWFEDSAARLQ